MHNLPAAAGLLGGPPRTATPAQSGLFSPQSLPVLVFPRPLSSRRLLSRDIACALAVGCFRAPPSRRRADDSVAVQWAGPALHRGPLLLSSKSWCAVVLVMASNGAGAGARKAALLWRKPRWSILASRLPVRPVKVKRVQQIPRRSLRRAFGESFQDGGGKG